MSGLPTAFVYVPWSQRHFVSLRHSISLLFFMVLVMETKAGLPDLANNGTGCPGKFEEWLYLATFCS